MKVLLLLSLIFNVLWALPIEQQDKLNSFVTYPSVPSFMPGYPIVDTYWFDMNYGDPSPTCDPKLEYDKMLGSGPLCNCLPHEMAVMGKKSVEKDGRVSCCLRTCYIGEKPLVPDALLKEAGLCCA